MTKKHFNEETNLDAQSLIEFSPGAIVVARPICGGKRVGALIDVVVARDSKLGGEVVAFFDKSMKRTTYNRSVGAIVRPTAYGYSYMVCDSGLVKICWEA